MPSFVELMFLQFYNKEYEKYTLFIVPDIAGVEVWFP